MTSVVILVGGGATYAITGSDSGDSSAPARAKAPSPPAVSARAKAGEASAESPEPLPSPTSTQKPFDLEPALARVGSAPGLDSANERLGLSQTQGGDGTVWGITPTTAEDQIRLLQSVFGDKSPLSEASRAYKEDLMRHVVGSQTWGLSAAADSGTTALKNGWLKRTQTRKWDVNSIGRTQRDGRVASI
ncbi:hypothetical protein ACFYZ3_28900 [Streptomyces sp. NPDC001599]|uniref:hypothetical protein n=1 Tax=Streptomyces sp. NPDC001599 TaxID=3364591 RepID=UPI003679DA67